MHGTLVLALLVVFTPFAARADPQLFHLAVSDIPVENGKVLNMEFQEISRDDEASIVQITQRSGASVSSSMFILRGMCGLMRSRGKRNFVPGPAGEGGIRYRVTFPAAPPERGKGFTIAQCNLLQF